MSNENNGLVLFIYLLFFYSWLFFSDKGFSHLWNPVTLLRWAFQLSISVFLFLGYSMPLHFTHSDPFYFWEVSWIISLNSYSAILVLLFTNTYYLCLCALGPSSISIIFFPDSLGLFVFTPLCFLSQSCPLIFLTAFPPILCFRCIASHQISIVTIVHTACFHLPTGFIFYSINIFSLITYFLLCALL